jgi:malonate-semialdehyde dehydrogenase (acetylating)/methylmalonate-semialdehyde dehydrogenase
VFNPNTGEVQAKVALASKTEVEQVIANAEAAQPPGRPTNPQRRARVMFKFLELIAKETTASPAPLLRARQGSG